MWIWLLIALAAALLVQYLSRKKDQHAEPTAAMEEIAKEFDPDDSEPIVVPIEPAIDLHPFAPQEIPEVIHSYLEAVQEKGFTEVRLIHGKGKGVQRSRVRSVLAQHPGVLDFRDSPPEQGGWGATLVQLVGTEH